MQIFSKGQSGCVCSWAQHLEAGCSQIVPHGRQHKVDAYRGLLAVPFTCKWVQVMHIVSHARVAK